MSYTCSVQMMVKIPALPQVVAHNASTSASTLSTTFCQASTPLTSPSLCPFALTCPIAGTASQPHRPTLNLPAPQSRMPPNMSPRLLLSVSSSSTPTLFSMVAFIRVTSPTHVSTLHCASSSRTSLSSPPF